MSLKRLLGNDLPTFLNEHYQRLPFSRSGGASELCSLGSWEAFARIAATSGADVMVVRRNQRHEGASPTTVEDIQRLVGEGYTLLVRHAERHDDAIGQLARDIATELAAPVNVHMYCTPAEQYGFSWHYDAEEVFIVQTTGQKEYSLRKNTVNPWPLEETLPADMKYEREIMPLLKCKLNTGDWFYIPSGYWHMGAASETAISLAIGVMPRTGVDLFDHARRLILDSLLWRQRLPVLGSAATMSEEDLQSAIQKLAEQLGEDFRRMITRPSFVKSLIESLRDNASYFQGALHAHDFHENH